MTQRSFVAASGCVLAAVIALSAPPPARADWPTTAYEHLRVYEGSFVANGIRGASDGQGGAILAWYSGGTVRARRVTADGQALWAANGLPVTTPKPDPQINPQIVSDGAGGAIVVWTEPDAGLFAQRLDANGTSLWDPSGVEVVPQRSPVEFSIAADGAGGALVAFDISYRNGLGFEYDIYAQRLGSGGERLWGDSAKAVCVSESQQTNPKIAATSTGVSAIAWYDTRELGGRIFAQSLSSTGDTLWNGARLMRSAGSYPDGVCLVPDGSEGWIFLWSDYEPPGAVWAQRIGASGMAMWAQNGVAAFAGDVVHLVDHAIPDGQGGVILMALHDPYESLRGEVQRLAPDGSRAWGSEGVGFSNVVSSWQAPQAFVSDGLGGAICLWGDSQFETRLYGQRFDDAGIRLWGPEGKSIELNPNVRQSSLVPDGNGGAIAAWSVGGQLEIANAHRVDKSGLLGEPDFGPTDPETGLAIERVFPNPSNASATFVRFRIPAPSRVRVSIRDLRGAHVRLLEDGDRAADSYGVYWNGLDDAGRRVASGIYMLEVVAGLETVTQKITRFE